MLDYMAIASYGVYPTPTPTGARRAVLAVSMGLINFTLSEDTGSGILKNIYKIGLRAFQIFTKRIIGNG